jgi:hypothetical protein
MSVGCDAAHISRPVNNIRSSPVGSASIFNTGFLFPQIKPFPSNGRKVSVSGILLIVDKR